MTNINMLKKSDWEWIGNTHEINPIEVDASWVCSMWRHNPTGIKVGLTKLVDLRPDGTVEIVDEIDGFNTGFSFLDDFDGFYHSVFDMFDEDEEEGCGDRLCQDEEMIFFDNTCNSLCDINKEYERMFDTYFKGYWEEHGYSVE